MQNTFRTIVNVPSFPFGINYETNVVMLGSCFTENIGRMLSERKLPVLINPFGVVYNPVSVAKVLNRIVEGKEYAEDDLIQHNNQWLSLDHHTSFSNASRSECLKHINQSLVYANQFWSTAQHLIVTFGTARVYHYRKTGLPVANCHKIPAKEFTHTLLSVSEIVTLWSELINKLIAGKPNLRLIFTVSPVRHWKDGAVGNQISKSTLLLAVSQLVERFPNQVFYFPSYELMMDDLRDYRFYNDDMLHPSPLAISYIWERFKHSLVSDDTHPLMNEIEKIQQAVNHRPFDTNTNEFRKFVADSLHRIDKVKSEKPSINLSNEVDMLKRHLE